VADSYRARDSRTPRVLGFPLDSDQVLQELGIRRHLLDGIQKRDVDLHLLEYLQNVLKLSSFLGRMQSIRVWRLRYQRPRRNLNSGGGCRWLYISLLCAPASLSFLCSRVPFRKNYLVVHLSPLPKCDNGLHKFLPMHCI